MCTAANASSILARIARHGIQPCRTTLLSTARSSPLAAATASQASPASFLARGIHSSPPTFRNKPPSSWGDIIPQPQPRPPIPSDALVLSKIILRPQYKRFGQNPGPGGRGGGRGLPILYDRRFRIIGGVLTVGAGGYYVTHLET